MAYTTAAAVRLVLARAADQYSSTAASLSDAQLDEAIDSASNEVNARLAHQYAIPFPGDPNTPPLIVEIVRDIAAYLADLTFRQDVDYTSDNEPMLLRHRRAQGLLEMLEAGTITLTGVDVLVPVDRPVARPLVTNTYSGDMFALEDFDLGYNQRGHWRYWPRTDSY